MTVITSTFDEHARVMAVAAQTLPPLLERVAAELLACFARGNKLLACGNGGSAADAEHLVAELVGRYRDERRGLPALSLVTGSATVTALANDYGFERVFARQVEALGRTGDMLIAISTSGRSPNVLAAAETARRLGLTVVAFTGEAGGPLASQADIVIAAPSSVTARIQEVHAISIHILCELVDAGLKAGGAA